MGDANAADGLAMLQAAMDPESWAEITAEYTAPAITAVREGRRCARCGAAVLHPQSHRDWHYEQTITIRAAMWLAMRAPVALAHLAKMLEETASDG